MREGRSTQSNRDAGGRFVAVPDPIDVVVRCRNEMPHARRALESLSAQRGPRARVLFVDNGSTDGSREAALVEGARVHDVESGDYVPGRVLNAAMRMTRSPVVAFVNADAVPLRADALGALVGPLLGSSRYAATFGRQIARPEADRRTRRDYERAFGSRSLRLRRGTFFSLAAAAVRRDVWEVLPFDETLRYSEDVDWVRRVQALGWTVRYVPEAEFEHSHRYSLLGHYRRRRGEGTADRLIYRLGPPTVGKDLVRPLAGALIRDLAARQLSPRTLATRVSQAGGYYVGRRRHDFHEGV